MRRERPTGWAGAAWAAPETFNTALPVAKGEFVFREQFFYKKASGNGVIDCNNGQTAIVTLKIRGGGLTFGKSEIEDGTGNFSDVDDISELFGAYAHAEAHAGASGSSSATVLTKGEVQLALAGTGKGWNLGVDFGKFTITPQ